MTGYDLAELERTLLDQGWTVSAQAFVTEQDVPGRVDQGGYTVGLTAPDGSTFTGQGSTRADALREAAGLAGQLPGDGLVLM